jgi:hypothetical protein
MARSTTHPGDDLLIAAMDRELRRSSHGAIAAHLSDCERCQRRAADLLAASAHLRTVLREDVRDDEHDAVRHHRGRARLVVAMRNEEPHTDRLGTRVGRYRVVPLAATVAVAGLMVVMLVTKPRDPEPGAIATAAEGALPIMQLTPGATTSLSASQLCAGEQPTNAVPQDVAQRVLKAYRMEHVPRHEYELDALITPELGGTADAANLWPQRYRGGLWNAHVKDQVEDYLREAVCSGTVDLRTAQQDIATNWVAAYQKYFHRATPLAATADNRGGDVPVLLIAGNMIFAESASHVGGP